MGVISTSGLLQGGSLSGELSSLQSAVANFVEGGSGITAIRTVEWDKKYLWVVDFTDSAPPAPFDAFFPANDVTVPMSILESRTIELPQTNISYPVKSQQQDIRITFYDDEQKTLLRWLTDWQKLDLLNLGQFTSGLGDSHPCVSEDSFGLNRNVQPLRQLKFGMLNSNKDAVLTKNFWVYPDGEITFAGGQNSEAQTYQVTFKVVKDGLNGKLEPSSIFSAKTVKQILGRLFNVKENARGKRLVIIEPVDRHHDGQVAVARTVLSEGRED